MDHRRLDWANQFERRRGDSKNVNDSYPNEEVLYRRGYLSSSVAVIGLRVHESPVDAAQ